MRCAIAASCAFLSAPANAKVTSPTDPASSGLVA